MSTKHEAEIVAQFSRQAIPFAQVPGHHDSLSLLVEMAQVTDKDSVLDLACGPGLVACEFARYARHVTGVDITPAMIEQARKRGQDAGLVNLEWVVGDVLPLPWSDSSFDRVITRYSFHHFLDPRAVLTEMIRICVPGGRVLVADVAVDPTKAAAYDRMEIMRDPSHTHALDIDEFTSLFEQSGLVDCRQGSYGVEIELEAQLRASFPRPGDTERLREMIINDIGVNRLGIDACRKDDTVVYTVPVRIFVGSKGIRS